MISRLLFFNVYFLTSAAFVVHHQRKHSRNWRQSYPAVKKRIDQHDLILLAHNNDDIHYRPVTDSDMNICYDIESSSYPSDEAASLESLKYRGEIAADYFRCAVLSVDEKDDKENDELEDAGDDDNINGNKKEKIVGFICATRCNVFNDESMSLHDPKGSLLAIHSVVVDKKYRRQGIATTMIQNYIHNVIQKENKKKGKGTEFFPPVDKIVLMAKSNLLGFYVNCGFMVTKPSDIVHGKDVWYDLELKIPPADEQQMHNEDNNQGGTQKMDDGTTAIQIRALPNADESWFVKTERFSKPFPIVKTHLEEHKLWVEDLRMKKNHCITSGYRVDADGKPGGGGMMFFAAKNYSDALNLILQDPLIVNDCVEWRLHGWISQVGDVQLR